MERKHNACQPRKILANQTPSRVMDNLTRNKQFRDASLVTCSSSSFPFGSFHYLGSPLTCLHINRRLPKSKLAEKIKNLLIATEFEGRKRHKQNNLLLEVL